MCRESVKFGKYQMLSWMLQTYFRQPREVMNSDVDFNTFKFEITWDKVAWKVQSFQLLTNVLL